MSKETNEKLFVASSILVVVTLPFSVRLNSYSIILLSLSWIQGVTVQKKWRETINKIRGDKFVLTCIALYLLHVIGLSYSDNIRQGFSELEKKAGFVIFPIILCTSSFVNKKTVSRILACFVCACFVGAVICLVNAMYRYLNGDSSYLFYHKLSSAIGFSHAVYFSFYVAFCIVLLIVFLKEYWSSLITGFKLGIVFLLIFFLLFLTLLSSKIIIPSVFLLIMCFAVNILFRNKNVRWAAIAFIGCLAIFSLFLIFAPNVEERLADTFIDKYEQNNPLLLDDYTGYHFTAGTIRLAIWKTVFEIIGDRNAWLYGVGTGDSQDILTSNYIKKHVYPGDESIGAEGFLHYNAHNQFFQFFLMFGVIGLLLFVYLVIILLMISIATHSDALFFLVIVFLLFCLTESVLHVQKGIVFFFFFSSLLRAVGKNTNSQT